MKVLSDLRIEGERSRLHLRGRGRTIVADARDSRSVRELLRAGPGRRWRLRMAARAHAALHHADLNFELRVGNRVLARAGRDARPTWPARLVGLPGLQLGWMGLWLGFQAAMLGWSQARERRGP